MAELTIERLRNQVIEAVGHPVDSRYAEVFWLPVLGPTTLWLLRHAAIHTAAGPYVVDAEELGGLLGVGGMTSRHCPLRRSLQRTVQFHVGRNVGDDHWFLPSHLPPLRRPQIDRLPETLRDAHAAYEQRAREEVTT